MGFIKQMSANVFFIKMLSCFVTFVVFFNVMFSALKIDSQLDFNEVSNIQKDVFTTVFFISDAVAKIGMDMIWKITTQKDSQQGGNTKSKQPVSNTSNDFILQPNLDRSSQLLKICYCVSFDCSESGIDLKFCDKHRICSPALVYFILMLLFFTSVKSMYDSVNNKIMKIYSLKPALC